MDETGRRGPASQRSEEMRPHDHAPLRLRGARHADLTAVPNRRASRVTSAQEICGDRIAVETRCVLIAHRSSLIAHRSSLIARGSSLVAHGSWLVAHGSSLMCAQPRMSRPACVLLACTHHLPSHAQTRAHRCWLEVCESRLETSGLWTLDPGPWSFTGA